MTTEPLRRWTFNYVHLVNGRQCPVERVIEAESYEDALDLMVALLAEEDVSGETL